jgi:DNA-3-methyladenine glycosylase
MQARRNVSSIERLCSGPGNLCQALAIGAELNGAAVTAAPFAMSPTIRPVAVAQGPRIGITAGAETPWRFAEAGSRYLSRPLKGPL